MQIIEILSHSSCSRLKMTTLYSVVEFEKDNEVAVVPCHWVKRKKNECSWPPRNVDVTSLVKSCAAKQKSWTSYKIEVLGEYESYSRAHSKMVRVEKGKEIESSCAEDGRRGQKKQKEKPVRLEFPSSAPKTAVNLWKSPSRPSTSQGSSLQLTRKPPGSVSRNLVEKRPNEQKKSEPKRPRIEESGEKEAVGTFSNSFLHSLRTPASSLTNSFRSTSQSSRDMSRDIQDILRGQARQKVQLQQLQAQLDKIQTFLVQNRKLTDDDDDDEENKVELPIKTVEELRKFDSRLEKEKKLRKFLRGEISSIGSSHAREGVRLGLRKILSDSLAMKFTWAGKSGKLKFKSLNICTQLQLAIKKLHNESEKNIDFFIGECLKHTKGKRNENPRPRNNNNDDDDDDDQNENDDQNSSGDENSETNNNSDDDDDDNRPVGWSAFDEPSDQEDGSEKENEDDKE